MSGDKVWVYDAVNRTGTADAISGETILGSYAQNQEVDYSNWDKFAGFIPGSVGETSTLLILLGAAILNFYKNRKLENYSFSLYRSCSNGIDI